MTDPRLVPLFAAAGLMIAAAAPSGSAVDLPGKALGAPVSCVKRSGVARIEPVAEGRVALFHMRGGKLFRNDLPGACPRIGRDSIVHASPVDLYCRNEVVRFADLSRGVETGVCTLGPFTPWQPAPPG